MKLRIEYHQVAMFVDELYQFSLLTLKIGLIEEHAVAAAARSWRSVFILKILALGR